MAVFIVFEGLRNELEVTWRDHRRFEREPNKVIIKMKNSVDKFCSSLDTAKEKIIRLENRRNYLECHTKRQQVENTDERSMYCVVPLI